MVYTENEGGNIDKKCMVIRRVVEREEEDKNMMWKNYQEIPNG